MNFNARLDALEQAITPNDPGCGSCGHRPAWLDVSDGDAHCPACGAIIVTDSTVKAYSDVEDQ
jgi:hypothetical protein